VRLWNKLRYLAALCAALGWWGAFYPELCLTADTYRVVREEGAEDTEYDDAAQLYWELLETDSSRIRFRSRLAELVQELMKGKSWSLSDERKIYGTANQGGALCGCPHRRI